MQATVDDAEEVEVVNPHPLGFLRIVGAHPRVVGLGVLRLNQRPTAVIETFTSPPVVQLCLVRAAPQRVARVTPVVSYALPSSTLE